MHRFILVVLAILVVAAPAPARAQPHLPAHGQDGAPKSSVAARKLAASSTPRRRAGVERLRRALGSSKAFAGAGMADRRELAEQLGMLGMFVLVVRSEVAAKPDPTVVQNLRFAAASSGEDRRSRVVP